MTYGLHMREHEGEVPYKCHICPRVFKYNTALKIHIQSHTDEQPHSFNQCSKAYKKSNDHDAQTGIKVRYFGEFKCTHCHKKFATKHSLQVHARIHTGVEPYKCFICKKTFKYATSLKVHNRTHTGERPFQCDYCSKAFGQQIDLYRHIRIHTGDRPYKCNQCEAPLCTPLATKYNFMCTRRKGRISAHNAKNDSRCHQILVGT